MPDQRSTLKEIGAARLHPMNRHCLEMLRKAKVPVLKNMVGAPELLEWVIENKKVEMYPGFKEKLTEAVQYLQRQKPKTATRMIDPEKDNQRSQLVKQALKSEEPEEVAKLLLENFHQNLSLTAPGYNHNVPSRL